MPSPTHLPRVVIVGCGFGGLEAARALGDAPVQITLVERTNHHLFQPLLYQVATAGLSAPAIAAPVRHLFRNQANVTTLLGAVTAIDVQVRQVLLDDGAAIAYDHLVVAAGATHSYFGRDDWAPFAPGLKTLEDAFEIRRRILLAFEEAEKDSDPARRGAKPGSPSPSSAADPPASRWPAPWPRSPAIPWPASSAGSTRRARRSC